MSINIKIEQETIENAFQKSLDDMLAPGNYNNPVKRVLDNMLGYSGLMTNEIGKQIQEFVKVSLELPAFQARLGEAIAKEMAKRAVDAMEKKK